MHHAKHDGEGEGIPRQEAGYALVAAVASILVFAMLALGVIAVTRRETLSGGAEIEQAQAAAAAEAGIAIALNGLIANDLVDRWSIDGRTRTTNFDRATLSIRVQDERGKVPLNLLDSKQLTALLESAGLADEPLRIARDSFRDWLDQDDDPRPDGAEIGFYKSRDINPRNGSIQSLGELGRIRGFDPVVVRRIGAIATVDFGSGPFDTRFAQPAAIGVMYAEGDSGPEAIQRAREAAGQVTALGFVSEKELVGRPLSVIVAASLPSGAKAERRCIVELTGADQRPYVVRYCS
jgi:general secretion pathway protein K